MKASRINIQSKKNILRSWTPYGVLVAALLLPESSYGQSAIYEFTGTPTADGQLNNVTTARAGGTFSPFTRTNVNFNAGANVFNSTSWSTSATIDTSKFVSFTITPDAGNISILQSLSFGSQRSNSGPSSAEVRLFGSTTAAALETQTFSPPPTSITTTAFNFKDIITAESLTFRFYGYNASSTGGTLRFDNVATTGANTNFSADSSVIALAANTTLYASSSSLSLTNTISGNFGLDKLGTNTATLSGTNDYTGPTSVSAGTLAIGLDGVGSIASDVSIASSATLAGTGTITGNVSVANGGTYSPGNGGIGSQTITGDLAFTNGSIFNWELNAPGGASGTGANQGSFDQVALTGALSGTSTFFINLLGVGFEDPFWSTDKSWTNIFTTIGSGTLESVFTSFGGAGVSSTGSTSAGQFTFDGDTLQFAAVPEPSSALAGILIVAGLFRRSRKRAPAARD